MGYLPVAAGVSNVTYGRSLVVRHVFCLKLKNRIASPITFSLDPINPFFLLIVYRTSPSGLSINAPNLLAFISTPHFPTHLSSAVYTLVGHLRL